MIPFNRASFDAGELELVTQAIANGHVSGNGPFTKRAEQMLSEIHEGSSVLLTSSCTHALEMAALLLDLEPGDEVIVPSFTFVTTASSFLLHGGTPVFVDSLDETLNIDPGRVRDAITDRTRAVCVVHYGGVSAGLKEFEAICDEHDLVLIEDNAHGLYARDNGRPLGTAGAFSTLSFHETKNLTCGEGGALVINDASRSERAEILRDKGTNRSRFLRGMVDKYTWVDRGSSWAMSDMLAAMLVGQLENAEQIQARRAELWARYARELADWADQVGARLPVVPDGLEHPAHLFAIRFESLERRDDFIRSLAARDIMAVFHYQALHLSPAGRRHGRAPFPCPVAEGASETLARLPLFVSLSDDDQTRVIEAVRAFR